MTSNTFQCTQAWTTSVVFPEQIFTVKQPNVLITVTKHSSSGQEAVPTPGFA